MSEWQEFLAGLWVYLQYPLFKLGSGQVSAWNIVSTIVGIALLFILLSKMKQVLLTKLSARKVDNFGNWRALITLLHYVLIAIGLISILQSSGLDLSMFTVLTGAVGIGIGFGMQTIVSNFVSGIILLLEKPLRLGDRIEVGDVAGNVHNIGVRATTIMTNDHVAIIVPNSDFISKTVVNWSYYGNIVRLNVPVNVAYSSDPDTVQKLLLEIAEKEPGVLADPAPTVRLAEFGDSALKFNLMIWTHDYADRRGALKSKINFAVWEIFKNHKIRFPYPQMDIHMIQENDT